MQQEIKYPRKIQIGFQEGTCPLRCNKCFAFSPDVGRTKKVTKMSIEKAFSLLDEIAESWNEVVVQPHIQTEPFANPDLKQIIQYCGEKKLSMSIITNGILLNDEWLSFLLDQFEQKITLSFSLDALTQEVYEKVRGNYSLKKIEEAIMYLLEKRKNKDLRIGVNFVIEEANEHEKDAFLDKWKYLADAVRITALVSHDRKTCRMDGLKGQLNTERVCPSLYEVMVIDADGTARVCPLDAFGDTDLGNVFAESVSAVWNGAKIESLREKICSGQLSEDEFCFGCEAYKHEGAYIRRTEGMFDIAENGYQIYYNHK